MSTSLAQQLAKLSVPQSSIYKDDKKRPSLLFDPKEAASKDRDTFYDIGISGLKELIELHDGFRVYEHTLFSVGSKDFERAVQSEETNKTLDDKIKRFLMELSPYFLLQSTHKALEWLVNRYQIHDYNQDEIMSLIMPYHETKMFIRFIQIMDLKNSSSRWNWLEPIQKPGIHLTKQVLFNHCATNPSFLKFISKLIVTYIKIFSIRANQLTTVFAFYCSTVIGSLDSAKRITESHINCLLPTVLKGLVSQVNDFRSSSYVILGFLITKVQMKLDTINDILIRMLTSEFTISYEMLLVVNLMCLNQTKLKKIPDEVIYNTSPEALYDICQNLKRAVIKNINVTPFIMKILSSTLKLIQENMEDFKRLCKLPEMLFDEINFSKTCKPDNIIECVINEFDPSCYKENDGYESDIEIIEEYKVVSNDMTVWYSQLLKNLELKYPDSFDRVIKEAMNDKEKMSEKRHAQLSAVLGFMPAVIHKIGDTYLFENLNHPNAQMRIEAIQYIGSNFDSLKSEDINFLKESLYTRYSDDNTDVVLALLKIPMEKIEILFNADELTRAFVNIVTKGKKKKKWLNVFSDAVKVFCSLDNLLVNSEIILAILPYLFPKGENEINLAYDLIYSKWGSSFPLTSITGNLLKNLQVDTIDADAVCETVFMTLESGKWYDGSMSWEYHSIDKNIVNTGLYILIKCFIEKKFSLQSAIDLLNVVIEFVKGNNIIMVEEAETFSGDLMPIFIENAERGKVIFFLIQYAFKKIIDGYEFTQLSKPWINFCETNEGIYLRQLYEVMIVGCSLKLYEKYYTMLLKDLLNRICETFYEKMEFFANFACGHIFLATKSENLISPELQLRSLKYLNELIIIADDVDTVYESNVFISLLFALNHKSSIIRTMTINIISRILDKTNTCSNCFKILFKELISRKAEIILDHEQINFILYIYLSQDKSVKSGLDKNLQVPMKNCFQILVAHILDNETPSFITSSLLNLLKFINNEELLTMLSSVGTRILQNTEETHFDIYKSTILRNLYRRIDLSSIGAIQNDMVWEFITMSLKEYRDLVIDESNNLISPCMLLMKEINNEHFEKFPNNQRSQFIELLCNAGIFSNNSSIASNVSKLIRKLHLHYNDFAKILDNMLNVKDPVLTKATKKNSSIKMLSQSTAETNEWKLGINLLEYIQSKKRLTIDDNFILTLFKLLQKCLDFEEQTYVEYSKQLLLSSILFYCQKLSTYEQKNSMASIKASFDIEIVVQCIRGTQNPQTHHHALMLLSHAAHILPEQVLHHTMAIFTFIGSSVLRHDDAYSFQIIVKIIETIIPIIVKLKGGLDEYNEKDLDELQERVVPVLRIFADVVLDVPEHRRLPLYKKLIEMLGASHFLWVFLALLLENHVTHFADNKTLEPNKKSKTLADQEKPINRLDFAQSLIMEFPANVILENHIKLIQYIKSLPVKKDENKMETDTDTKIIFSIVGHSALQLRQFTYTLITFMNNCLSSPNFRQHVRYVENTALMEQYYKTLIINILTYIQSVSKITDKPTVKYWKVMLHYSYDLLDNVNNLLSAPMFISVVRGLMTHHLQTVKRKTMELLNSKIQFDPEMFAECDKELMFSLLPALMLIIDTIGKPSEDSSEIAQQELELNQQTALLSMKLLTRLLASENPIAFKPLLETVTELVSNSQQINENVVASIVLCLAELCSNLKAHVLSNLHRFMPALISILNHQRKIDTPELILLSTITALCKIVENLPLFLSPYLKKIIFEYSILMSKWKNMNQECTKVSAVISKLSNIKNKISSSIAPRVLIPVINQSYIMLLNKGYLEAVGPAVQVLAESFTNITTGDFHALQQDLTTFFLQALQLRSNYVDNDDYSIETLANVENDIINALVNLVFKLSENSFRPFYYKIYDWAIRSNNDKKDCVITFYRLSYALADRLKGLFVLFAGHFIKNASELLDSCNTSKNETLYFESEEKCCVLIKNIMKTLQTVFYYDSQNFINKERFETLMQPIVDQLENTICGMDSLKLRVSELVNPCISQFAVAIADDSLWKPLNYQILLKTRHSDAQIRLLSLECFVSMATQLGNSWLPLLAESVPFLSELLEDGDASVEDATKEAIRKLEKILDEPLQKYF